MGKDKKDRYAPPKCKAILVCQRVIDQGGGRVTIHKVWSDFAPPYYPIDIGDFTVYLHLVAGIGTCIVDVNVVERDTGEVVARVEGIEPPFNLLHSRTNLPVPVESFVVKRPGLYDVIAYANGREIGPDRYSCSGPLRCIMSQKQPPGRTNEKVARLRPPYRYSTATLLTPVIGQRGVKQTPRSTTQPEDIMKASPSAD